MPVMLKRSAYNGCGQSLFSFLFLPQQRVHSPEGGIKWDHRSGEYEKDDTQIREAFPYFGPS